MSDSEAIRSSSGPSGLAPGLSGSALVTLSADQFAQLMSAISASQTRMDEKLEQFQDEIRHGQEEAASRALKRARYDKPYTFRKRGNEEQANFNAKVDEAFAQAESDLSAVEHSSSSTGAVQRIKEAIKKGRSLLEERQKLIRLADRSEHGWGVVDEYTADDLAEESNDEKRIEKAERAAERKAGKCRKKRGAAPAKPRGGSSCFAMAVQPSVAGTPAAMPLYGQPRHHAPPPPARPVRPCHFCGKMGHLLLYCPARAAAASRKWYPFQKECVLGVDVEDRESSYRAVECVNSVNVRSADACCEGKRIAEGVDCIDTESSETTARVTSAQAVAVLSTASEG